MAWSNSRASTKSAVNVRDSLVVSHHVRGKENLSGSRKATGMNSHVKEVDSLVNIIVEFFWFTYPVQMKSDLKIIPVQIAAQNLFQKITID